MKDHLHFQCIGYKEYLDEAAPKILPVLEKAVPDPNYKFVLAVNEAVLNAAKYSVYGVLSAQIDIDVRVDDLELRVRIESQTQPFDAIQYRDNLVKLAEDPKYGNLDWGDYTGVSDMSRGFWIILSAVDYLIIEATGQHITLVRRLPWDRADDTCKINKIVPRFCVESQTGVIIP